MAGLPTPLAPLAEYRQFCLYKLVPRGDGKTDKFPCDAMGNVHDAHDSAIWLDADSAYQLAEQRGAGWGVAFVFTSNDPFFFVDVDDCLTPDNTWSAVAQDVMNRLAGAAVEVSQSGRGLHIIGRGAVTDDRRVKNGADWDLYTKGRFVALTGTNAIGDAGTDHTPALCQMVVDFLQLDPLVRPEAWTDGPAEGYTPPVDDSELIRIALTSNQSARVAFGGAASLRDLWTANTEVLERNYPPDQGGEGYDASKADAALAQHLSFWTAGDCERVKRLMVQSGLNRDKYHKREDYLTRTITKAVAQQTTFFGEVQQAPATTSTSPVESAPAVAEVVSGQLREGHQFLGGQQQVEYFKGCVYIQKLHKIFTPSGEMMDQGKFRAMFGGYDFGLDHLNERTTRNAWEAFTESQAVSFPKVSEPCFRPDQPSGSIIVKEGLRMVNTYVPIEVPCKEGDAEPFFRHLRLVLPDERDRQILLAYMSACVQHQGVKFQWAPLLQGAPGNGKTLFTRCVAHAVGKRYTHMPKADQIDSQFNSWLLGKVFYGVEDIYVPEHKREVIETLKPMITGGDGIEVQYKGVDQYTAEICGNFILNSNHKNPVHKTKDDRRFAVFFTAQQSVEDLQRDGMNDDYFVELYDWLKEEGYAIVTHFLKNYQIPDALNPATSCQRAPTTSTTDQAIEAAMGSVEQEILEAVSEDRVGFAGGWVSSFALDKLLAKLKAERRIPPQKRRELMQTLGYDWHPHLNNGRVNNVIPLDEGKPRLYIKNGHISRAIETPNDVAKAYMKAQGVVAFGEATG